MSGSQDQDRTASPEHTSWGFSEGEELVPHLRMQRSLGGGPDFESFVAFDDRLLASVVIKMPRPHLVGDEAVMLGLEREARFTETLRHPNIVRAYHAELSGPRPFIELEFLRGEVLEDIVDRDGPLEVTRLCSIGASLASAVHYLHLNDVVHLDIRPANVIVDHAPRIIDFNLAFRTDEASRLVDEVGTRGFLAPEQCAPPTTGVPAPPSDVWGLGATLFYCASGESPFPYVAGDEATPLSQRFPQINAAPRPLPAGTNIGLHHVITACLRTRPDARPTPASVYAALTALSQDPQTAISIPSAGPTSASSGDERERYRAAMAARGMSVGRKKPTKGRR